MINKNSSLCNRAISFESLFTLIVNNHLNFNRTYASSGKAFKGKSLCHFIGASLYMFLERRIKEYEATDAARKDKIKLTNKSMSRIIDDLNTIMLTSYKGGYFFDEVCGKYRTYFNSLGIEVQKQNMTTKIK